MALTQAGATAAESKTFECLARPGIGGRVDLTPAVLSASGVRGNISRG